MKCNAAVYCGVTVLLCLRLVVVRIRQLDMALRICYVGQKSKHSAISFSIYRPYCNYF